MVILSVENISKTVKDEPLFQDVTFGMQRGEKIGLVGPNGCGKSTFLRVLDGSTSTDSGTVAKARELSISVLEQQPRFQSGQKVEDFLLDGDHPSIHLLRTYHTLVEEGKAHTKASGNRLHQVMEQIEHTHAWDVQTRFASFLGELQGPSLDTPMEVLSGGMLKKVAIARVLAVDADLLLLDEPTNHLDIPTIQWLERYLASPAISVVLVTHDRYLLDHVCTGIMEFDRGYVYQHPGAYTQFLQRREERLSSLQAEQDRLKTVLRRELEWLSRGPKARTGKDSGRKNRIGIMQDSLTTEQPQMAGFTSLHRRMGKKILELENIGKTYGDTPVVLPFTHSFSKGERIGLIGPNGSGKTTLLEMIAGRIEPDQGIVDVGLNTAFGYYDQLDTPMDLGMTVLEHISEIAEEVTVAPGQTLSAARFLELFGFPVSFHRISIGLLSGGERRRLHLVGVLMQAPNFLLLDEPTNDLDIDTIRRLEEYLLDFAGCALVVSHDRAFLDRIADTLFVFSQDGCIEEFAGSFSDYQLALVEEEKTIVREVEEKKSRPSQREKKTGLTFKERKELELLVSQIDVIEGEIAALEASFASRDVDPTTLAQRTQAYAAKQALLEKNLLRWEELAAKE
ncbi:MAG: ABC transporter ATP-binding protein [Spirochaetae bacterium HGW-Spirochaetae-4]|jgi:ATP-binding cassette subfamily F protein uup|nr:MAG: hypothetical protein A2Y31_05420 [Spirochaetes bacterium GWC2_52_13]PKL22573.1 MAG: ABC transporter ATP-binding protein [Spirochaetae bacterium HGW-Spirochaetae-4]HCG63914.1 ABC transporter ATP-binding protein [Sphaerochaeta sp.]HCS37220.1 ABC transporter ATP-binding protein [Sphaerochaeta sp.]